MICIPVFALDPYMVIFISCLVSAVTVLILGMIK